MKPRSLNIALLLVISAFATACDQENPLADDVDKVSSEVSETLQLLDNYTYGQKPQYIEGMQKRLEECDSNLDRFTDSMSGLGALAKAEAEPQIAALRELSASLHESLKGTDSITEGTWVAFTEDLQNGYKEIRENSDKLGNLIAEGASKSTAESGSLLGIGPAPGEAKGTELIDEAKQSQDKP